MIMKRSGWSLYPVSKRRALPDTVQRLFFICTPDLLQSTTQDSETIPPLYNIMGQQHNIVNCYQAPDGQGREMGGYLSIKQVKKLIGVI